MRALKVGESRRCGADCSVTRLPDAYGVRADGCKVGPLYIVRTGWGASWTEKSERDAWASLRDALIGRGLSPGMAGAFANEYEAEDGTE